MNDGVFAQNVVRLSGGLQPAQPSIGVDLDSVDIADGNGKLTTRRESSNLMITQTMSDRDFRDLKSSSSSRSKRARQRLESHVEKKVRRF